MFELPTDNSVFLTIIDNSYQAIRDVNDYTLYYNVQFFNG